MGESAGYDSYDVKTTYFAAANTEEEVRALFWHKAESIKDIRPFPDFPSLARKRKPFVFDPTPEIFVF